EWMTAGALFRSEIGDPVANDPAGRRRLNNEELALALGSILSTFRPGSPMWESPGFVPPSPDDVTPANGWLQQVRAAAADGSIQNPAVMRNLILASSGGNDPLRRDTLFDSLNGTTDVPARGEYWLAPRLIGFFREWLAYGGAINAFKDT